MTLLEVVIVLVIMATLLGMSVAIFRNSNRDLGVRAATNRCVSLIREVSDHARMKRMPAWVVLDFQESAIHALTEEPIQAWNFEDTRGAFGKTCIVNNAQAIPGHDGSAYMLRSSSTIDCGEVPIFTPDQGLSFDFWIFRVASRGGLSTILSIGDQVEVKIDGMGRISAKIAGVNLNGRDFAVPMERWTRVRAICNGMEGRLYINESEADVRTGRATWSKVDRLIVGAKKDGFVGIVDSLRVGLVIAREKFYLPSEAKFVLPQGGATTTTTYIIGFTPEGRLDAIRHPTQVTFLVRSPTDEKTVTISPLGHVVR